MPNLYDAEQCRVMAEAWVDRYIPESAQVNMGASRGEWIERMQLDLMRQLNVLDQSDLGPL